MTKRFQWMKLVENIGVKSPLLTNNLSYPGIKKKLMFCETSDQYLVANVITVDVTVTHQEIQNCG